MALRSPEATDALISAMVLRYHGINYEKALSGLGVHPEVTPAQFSIGLTRSLDGLVEYASGRNREILEEIRDDQATYKELFRMSPSLLQRQHAAVMGGDQKRFYKGTYEHKDNVDWLTYYALISQDADLESHNRATVVNALRRLPSDLGDYFTSLKLGGMINWAFGKGAKDSPLAALQAFDRAYMDATGDKRSLFDLSVSKKQGGHLHFWEYCACWEDEESVETAAYHLLTENIPGLLSKNGSEVVETLGNLTKLSILFSDIGLSGMKLKTNSYYKEYGCFPLAVFKAFDKVHVDKGNASVFDPSQSMYFSEDFFLHAAASVQEHKILRGNIIHYNKIFHPTQITNGVPITLEQASEELRQAIATGASPYLGDILRVAGRTGETPQLVAEVRDNFPWLTWQQFVEQAGFDYADYLPSIEVREPGVNGTNGKTSRGLPDDSIEVKLIPKHNVLTVPIWEGKETQDVLDELLADDYEPTRIRKPRNKVEKTKDMSSFKYLKALMCSRPILDRDEERTVLMEMKHYELKARQAAQTNDVKAYENYKRRWEQVREYFIESNMRLVVGKAGRVANNSDYIFQELIQEASKGLMRASELFAYWEGNKFSTYANYWIDQKILRYFYNKTSTIRTSQSMGERRTSVNKATKKLKNELGEEPTLEQIAEELELSPEQVQKALDIPKEPKSLTAPTGDSETWNLMGIVADTTQYTGEEASEPMEAMRLIEDTLEACTVLPSAHPLALSYRQELILRHSLTLESDGGQGIGRGFYHKTNIALAQEFDVTPQAIGQAGKKARAKFEAALMINGLVPVDSVDEELVAVYREKISLFEKLQAAKRKKAAAAKAREQPTAEVIKLQQPEPELEQVSGF